MPGRQDDTDPRREIRAVGADSGPLDQRLRSYRDWVHRQWPHYADINARFVKHLVASGAGQGGPAEGNEFPDFLLPNQDGHLVRLHQVLQDRAIVLSFNRGHWCGFCQVELMALHDAVPQLQALGAQLLSVIPEPQTMALQLRSSLDLDFDVLSDMDLALATSLDLTVYLGEELRTFYLTDDIDVGAYQLTDGWFLPIPATFVINQDRRVMARFIDPDFRNRMTVEAIVGALGDRSSSGRC
jgi:peroxiredoxin